MCHCYMYKYNNSSQCEQRQTASLLSRPCTPSIKGCMHMRMPHRAIGAEGYGVRATNSRRLTYEKCALTPVLLEQPLCLWPRYQAIEPHRVREVCQRLCDRVLRQLGSAVRTGLVTVAVIQLRYVWVLWFRSLVVFVKPCNHGYCEFNGDWVNQNKSKRKGRRKWKGQVGP